MASEREIERPGDMPFSGAPLIVDLEGYEGPLDVLLTLARDQKVDLRRISILDLAEQYLEFIAEARKLRLEIAADYLVMAAWLAYLKSRLLLPEPEDDEPSGEEMAARLAFQLRRLEAMRDAAARLMARERLGRDVFPRGAPEGIRVLRTSVFELSLYDLLKAYADQTARRTATEPLRLGRGGVYSVEDALARFSDMLGRLPDWATLQSFLPSGAEEHFDPRSTVASTFAASLELTRQGKLRLRQGRAFGPIYIGRAQARE